jgi:hypothetical protein
MPGISKRSDSAQRELIFCGALLSPLSSALHGVDEMPEGPDYLDLAMEALSAALVASNPERGKNFCQLAAAYIALERFHQRSIEQHYGEIDDAQDE